MISIALWIIIFCIFETVSLTTASNLTLTVTPQLEFYPVGKLVNVSCVLQQSPQSPQPLNARLSSVAIIRLYHGNKPVAALTTDRGAKRQVELSKEWLGNRRHSPEQSIFTGSATSMTVKMMVQPEDAGQYSCSMIQMTTDVVSNTYKMTFQRPVGPPSITIIYGTNNMKSNVVRAKCSIFAGVPSIESLRLKYVGRERVRTTANGVKFNATSNTLSRAEWFFLNSRTSTFFRNASISCTPPNHQANKVIQSETLPVLPDGFKIWTSPKRRYFNVGETVRCRSNRPAKGDISYQWRFRHGPKGHCITVTSAGSLRFSCKVSRIITCRVTLKVGEHVHQQEKDFSFFVTDGKLEERLFPVVQMTTPPPSRRRNFESLDSEYSDNFDEPRMTSIVVLSSVILVTSCVLVGILCYFKFKNVKKKEAFSVPHPL